MDNPQKELDRLRSQQQELGQQSPTFGADTVAAKTITTEAAAPVVQGGVAKAQERIAQVVNSPQMGAAIEKVAG